MKKCCFTFLACPLRVNYNCSACVKSRIVLWFVPSLKKRGRGNRRGKQVQSQTAAPTLRVYNIEDGCSVIVFSWM